MQRNAPETFSPWHFVGNETTDVQFSDTEKAFLFVCRGVPCHWSQTCCFAEQGHKACVAICSPFISRKLLLPTPFPASFHVPCPPHSRHRVLLSLSPLAFGCARARRCCGSWALWDAGAVQPARWPSSTGGCWARTVLAEPPSSFHTLLFVACRELASAGAEPSGKFTLSSPTGLIHWRV